MEFMLLYAMVMLWCTIVAFVYDGMVFLTDFGFHVLRLF